jgi:hypothetical protein
MNEPASTGRGMPSSRVGEVVESASHRFVAQCYSLYQSPPLGSFVCTESYLAPGERGADGEGSPSRIYAVVYGVSTEALDAGRPVIARGQDEDSEQDVYRSHPQLERLLCTRFESLIVGHGNSGTYSHRLPALPPRIHSFVYTCLPEDLKQFTRSLDFLSLLVNSSPSSQAINDEVVAACLRQAGAEMEDPRSFLVGAGKALAVQLTGDLPRMNAMLRRLSS